MASRSYAEEQNLTPPGDLREHAALAVLRQAEAGLPGMSAWLACRVQKEPVRIYDINSALLFLDYPVARGSDIIGYVRTAASQVVGAPVLAIEMGQRSWNFDAAVRRLKPRVKKEFPRAKLSDPLLVCYSYPKLGVMFSIEGEGQSRVIYDVADLARINDKPERPDNEGSYAWSFYGRHPGCRIAGARLRRFNAADDARLQIASRVRAEMVSAACSCRVSPRRSRCDSRGPRRSCFSTAATTPTTRPADTTASAFTDSR